MAEKKDSLFDMVKLGLILVCYAVVSCTVLAVVNNFTSPKIAQNQKEKADQAMREIIPEAEKFIPAEDFEPCADQNIRISDFYIAVKSEMTVCGAVCQVSGPTYDKGKIIIGIDNDGKIAGMRFLELSDSPGFGLKANDSSWTISEGKNAGKTFYGQFTGLEYKDGFHNGSNFDCISGATITSKGAGELVSAGTESLSAYLENAEKTAGLLNKTQSENTESTDIPDSSDKNNMEGTESSVELPVESGVTGELNHNSSSEISSGADEKQSENMADSLPVNNAAEHVPELSEGGINE